MVTSSTTKQQVTAAMPMDEVADLLGETTDQVRRRVELGMLATAHEGSSGEELITRESLEQMLDFRRSLAVIADFPIADDEEEVTQSTSTLLSQMLAFARALDEPSRPNRVVDRSRD